MTVKYLVPLSGLRVLDPIDKQPLPGKGMIKPWTGVEGRYWRRRFKDGSVKEGTPSKKQTIKKKDGGDN